MSLERLKSLGISSFTDVQKLVVPEALKGKSLFAQCTTGTGKTLCYTLPIVERLLKKAVPYYAVIVVPTNDLAQQVSCELRRLGAELGIRIALLACGDVGRQKREFDQRPHVLVTTDGSLLRHSKTARVAKIIQNMKMVVLDEADALMETWQHMERLFSPKQWLLFSATTSPQLEQLLQKHKIEKIELNTALKINKINVLGCGIPQLVLTLRRIGFKSCIVFVASRNEAGKIAGVLSFFGINAVAIHGGIEAKERVRLISSTTACVFVTTNVVARGIDLVAELVVCYRVDNENVEIHRVGRVARNGRGGTVVKFGDESWGKTLKFDEEELSKIEERVPEAVHYSKTYAE